VTAVRLLGPVDLLAAGDPLDVGPPQRRAVLAALAVDAGRPVTTETLIDRVWGPDAPDGARRALHAHIARLRRLPVTLDRWSGGYQLGVEQDEVDLHRFRGLLDRARDAALDDAERRPLLDEALALWRGEPLAGLGGEWADRVREVWRRHRVDAVVAWSQLRVRSGDPAAAIAALTDLAVDEPLAEPVAAALMQAQYAAGRPAEALEVYRDLRRRLVEELGADPGPQLREVHEAVLRGDAARLLPGAGPAPAAPVEHPVPAQLPPDVPGFSGRRGQLAELDAMLTGRERAGTVVVTALAGTAGVGKTALAVHWAHGVRDRFPDGQLYVNLRGFDPGDCVMDPAEAVRGFLAALGVPQQRVPPQLDAQVGLYRSLVAGKQLLVVLDNARDAAQVRPLLPGDPSALVLVTSRSRLAGLIATDGARPLLVDLLSEQESRDLLTRRLGPRRVLAEPAAVQEIIARSAGLPLALTIVAARAAADPAASLAVVAEELRDVRYGLDVLSGDDPATDVRAVFSWSYRTLGEPAARVFRLLGLHPGPDVGLRAAAALTGLPAGRVRQLLGELTRAHLVFEHRAGRFGMHDLLRAYAAELAAADDESARDAATRRLLDHYLHSAYSARLRLAPLRQPIELAAPEPLAEPEEPADAAAAFAWFDAEQAILPATVGIAARAESATRAWQLAWTVSDYLFRRGPWPVLATVQRTALDAAERAGDPIGRAHAHSGLARACALLGRYDDAHDHYERAAAEFDRLGDHAREARTHLDHGFVFAQQQRHAEALAQAERAVDLYEAADEPAGRALALNAVGWCHTLLGDHHQALERCGQALGVLREIGDRHGEAAAWDSLGYAHHHLGDHAMAATCYRRSLALCREFGDRSNEATVLVHLGDTCLDEGDVGGAREAWRQAVEILDEFGQPEADRVRAKLADLDARWREAGA
jgi:DNA-binding SARP family transcriptional activator/tetratricopeptide (TPR) repeat protein